ncbi:hypothetical protein JOQ06_029355, partial [Pogonophryne albipinna]
PRPVGASSGEAGTAAGLSVPIRSLGTSSCLSVPPPVCRCLLLSVGASSGLSVPPPVCRCCLLSVGASSGL